MDGAQIEASYDTNFWKTFVAARLRLGVGDPEAILLHDGNHDMLIEHLTSEYPIRTEAKGRTVDEWTPTPRENHGWDCYDDQTDVLTKSGWKRFSDVEDADELATVNLATDEIEYQRPLARIAKHHRGQMIQIGGVAKSRIDICVTPTHRMVVYEGQSSRGPVIKAASELSVWDKIKTRAKWTGNDYPSIDVPATSRSAAAKIDAKDLAAFIGWYVAEGSCRINTRLGKGKTHVTVISQNPGPKRNEILAIASRLPWSFHESKTGVVLSNEQVYRLVCDLGDKYTKRVPQWIKDASPRIIAAFVQSAVSGDGWRDRNHEAYASVSPGLAGDMAELYLKLGYGCSMRVREGKPYTIRGRSGSNVLPQHHVHRSGAKWGLLRDSRNTPNFHSVEYDGMVYCATVQNGTLIVRRNGKIAVSGNCLVGAAVAASITGIQPSGGEAAGRQRKKVSIPTGADGKRVIVTRRAK